MCFEGGQNPIKCRVYLAFKWNLLQERLVGVLQPNILRYHLRLSHVAPMWKYFHLAMWPRSTIALVCSLCVLRFFAFLMRNLIDVQCTELPPSHVLSVSFSTITMVTVLYRVCQSVSKFWHLELFDGIYYVIGHLELFGLNHLRKNDP